jgi:hypothetical protein
MPSIKKMLLIIGLLIFILIMVVFVVPMARSKIDSVYSSTSPDPFIKSIAQDFKTKAWQEEDKEKRDEKKLAKKAAEDAEETVSDLPPQRESHQLAGDAAAGEILDKNIKEIEISGLDAGQKVIDILAQSLTVSSADFEAIYTDAYTSSSLGSFYARYVDTDNAGLAVEIYLRADIISYLIEKYQH